MKNQYEKRSYRKEEESLELEIIFCKNLCLEIKDEPNSELDYV